MAIAATHDPGVLRRDRGRTIFAILAGLLALFLLVSASVVAAPAITVTPAAGPGGTTFTLTGTAFPASAALTLFLEDVFGRRVQGIEVPIQADASGGFTLRQPTLPNTFPDRYSVVIAARAGGEELARGTVTITSPNGEVLAIAPTSGPAGARFTVTGTNLPPGATVTYGAINAQNQPGPVGQVQVGADGRIEVSIDSSGYAPGLYRAFVSSEGRGLAAAHFTVTAAGTPGLPNTGAGRATAPTGLQGRLLLGLGLAVLVCSVCLAVRGGRHRPTA